MSTLHEALKWLRPKPFSDVPLEDLGTWMADVFANSEVAVNSVPHPPGGTEFTASKRSRTDANGATCAAEMTVSEARPPPVDPSHEELRKSWGKPLKVNDNALGIAVYKMAGMDRHGSWFARKSIHEGLGFTKWKKAMQREFSESLAVEGGPGSGCVRGIGGDRRLEQRTVEGVGQMEVLQLSAQFPGPTSPREFITLLLTSDNALTEKSKPHITPLDDALDQLPRHYMVVSIPTEHPDAPPRDAQGLVKGQYESIEMIREIPLTPSKNKNSKSTERRDNVGEDDPETNPVEWVMITRSDPGGGIPRFMVDRGTPGSIVADTKKFLDWACARDHVPDPDEGVDPDEAAALTTGKAEKAEIYDAAAGNAHGAGVGTSIADHPTNTPLTRTTSTKSSTGSRDSGLVSGLTTALGNGIQNYAPQSVASYLQPSPQPVSPASTESTESETSSLHSFTSAQQWTTATEHGSKKAPSERLDPVTVNNSSESLGASSSTGGKSATPSSQRTPYEKELAKIDSKRAAIEVKLRRAREKEASRTEANTAREEREKRKAQEKYEKEVAKLAAKREKEEKKMVERRRKDEGKREADRFKRERDEWKGRAEVAEMEVKLLRDQVRELQKENTVLVQAMGRSEEGRLVLKSVADEIGAGSDAGSAKSKVSR